MESLLITDALISFFTRTLLEVVLGIDNVIFITIVAGTLPVDQRKKKQIAAVVASTFIMIAFPGKIGDFVNNHPSIKILALSFLLMMGTLLVAEAFHYEIPKGYAYFAMAFSFIVKLLNMKFTNTTKEPVNIS